MSNFDKTEDECECMTCSLVEEFRLMLQDGVDWESALRHVIGIATSVSDEQVADMADEIYKDGIVEGIRQTADMMIELADEIEGTNVVEFEKVEDLTDEQFEDVQSLLRKQISDN